MRFHIRAFLVAVAVVACASGVRAQEYGAVVVFGDSLSDSGNVAEALPLGLPAGRSFTTNPDPIWAEIVAETYDVPGGPSHTGGTNFAVGGACVNRDTPCHVTVPVLGRIEMPRIDQQIDEHLLTRAQGEADPNHLYAVWAGSNDLVAILEAVAAGEPVNPQTAIPATAQRHVGEIQRLQQAGARHIVVLNLPDAGQTPFAQSIPDPSFPPTLTALATAYNQALNAGLGTLDDGIVPIDAFGLFNALLATPERYGFTNVAGTACAPVSREINSIVCAPAGSGSPVTYAPGSNRTHLFADDKHPSGGAHAILARVVTATLKAPIQVSLAGEAGEAAVAAHRSVVAAEQFSDRERSVGRWHSYAVAHTGRRAVDAPPRLGEAQVDEQAVTLGFGQRASRDFRWGVALSLGRHDNGVEGAALESETAVGSLHATWQQGGLQLSGAVNLGRTGVDIERSMTLGPAVDTERGSTAGRQVGVDFGLGWTMGEAEGTRHGPVLGLSWLDQEVNGYRESGTSPTAMNFAAFERGSLVARAGYRFSFEAGSESLGIRPYAAATYAKELDGDPVSVTAGSNTMNGQFTAEGFAPPEDWLSVDLGVSMSLGGQASAVLGYSGRTGDGSRSDHLVNVGLRVVF
ncbi:MAG: autotransporter domain-containing protein [Rhodospirillales bacterium]|nr:autotransporter domain-containing protein [Rhodospirillales bacterium]